MKEQIHRLQQAWIFTRQKKKKKYSISKEPPPPPSPPFNYLPFLSIFMTPLCLNIKNKNPSLKFRGRRETEDRQSLRSFWALFCTLSLLTTRKIKTLKKMQKMPRDLSFYPKMRIIWCTAPEIWSTIDKIFVILDQFLPFYL